MIFKPGDIVIIVRRNRAYRPSSFGIVIDEQSGPEGALMVKNLDGALRERVFAYCPPEPLPVPAMNNFLEFLK